MAPALGSSGILCLLAVALARAGNDDAGGGNRSDAHVDGLVLLQREVRVTQAFSDADEDGDAWSRHRKPEDVSSQRGIILRYMPSRNVAICACAKCGSTSLWSWLFENEFKHSFHADPDRNDHTTSVQDVMKTPWHGKFDTVTDKAQQDQVFKKAFTYALIRDPKERLISSWKSKVACKGGDYGTDIHARDLLVRRLKELGGRGDASDHGEYKACMKLKTFVRTLRDIHRGGKAHNLNGHFMPQDQACFAHQPPAKWDQVTDIVTENPFASLARRINFSGPVEHSHSSMDTILITKGVDRMLNEITASEYTMLKPYLSRPSRVRPGEEVLLQTPADVVDLRDE